MKINLIYGTETGFTKSIGEDILRLFPDDETRLIKVDEAATEDWRADLLILGAPTWCEPRLDEYGQYSDDWNDTYQTFSKIDFTGQKVALYGLGDQIGYGISNKVTKKTKVAIVPIGYADGFSRSLGNGVGKMIVNNKLVPTIGNICMDMTFIDVTDLDVKIGDKRHQK